MTATISAQDRSARAPSTPHGSREGTYHHPATAAVRADCADARWTVRVVLEADIAMMAVRTVRAIIFDRDSGASVLHTVWADWHDIPLLVAHMPAAPLANATLETSALNLARALLTLLGRDATACLTALRAGDIPPPLPGMSRRERQYRQIIRDAAWHDPRATDRPYPA